MSAAIPVIICGKTAAIAKAVIEGYKPDYEVIHCVFSKAQGVAEIPSVLDGKAPGVSDPKQEQLGTKDYSKHPVAVITGGAYDEVAIEEMRAACTGRKVAWLACNTAIPTPPLGPAYGTHIMERHRSTLKRLMEERKLGKDGLYYY